MILRVLLLGTALVLFMGTLAQERPAALAAEKKRMSMLLRARPPEVALRHVDSLLTVPSLTADAVWRIELSSYRGHALRLLGRLDEAMAAQIRAFEVADSIGDHLGRIDALLGMAIIHMDLGELDRADRELREVFRLNEEKPANRSYRVPLVLGAWADHREMGDSALYWYDVAYPMAEAAGDSFVMADLLFNRGVTQGALGRQADSERSFLQALEVMPSSGYPQVEGRVSDALAYLYLEQGRLDKVEPLLDRAYALARQHGAGDLLVSVLGDRIEYRLALEDSAAALDDIYRMLSVKDSLAGILRDRALAEAQARFGVSRMEKELAIAKAEKEANALRAQRSRLAWAAVAIIIVLSVVLIASFRRQAKLKQLTAERLELAKERLLEENEMLHQENLMARFETLKSQIDPHFLFNAMNTLYTLVETEPAKAREFIASFSALYRRVLGSRDRTIVPVQDELELVQHYLFLQRMRFSESLQVSLDLPADALRLYLPPFTLQMLLENAIKHNVISASKPLQISVRVEADHLVVTNDLRPRGTSEAGTGTGLENIRRRYAMLGGTEPTFSITEGSYVARVPLLSAEP